MSRNPETPNCSEFMPAGNPHHPQLPLWRALPGPRRGWWSFWKNPHGAGDSKNPATLGAIAGRVHPGYSNSKRTNDSTALAQMEVEK